MIPIADFTVSASINLVLTNAEIKRAAKDLRDKLRDAVSPITLRVAAPSLKAVNAATDSLKKNMQGLVSDAELATSAFRNLGSAGAIAFREIAEAKDALRRNITLLEADLKRLSGALRTSLGGAGSVEVAVIPIFDALALRALPPIPVPVIPFIAEGVVLPPLAVPVIPILATNVTFQALSIPVIPILEDLAATLEPIKVNAVLEVDRKALEGLSATVKAALDIDKKPLEGLTAVVKAKLNLVSETAGKGSTQLFSNIKELEEQAAGPARRASDIADAAAQSILNEVTALKVLREQALDSIKNAHLAANANQTYARAVDQLVESELRLLTLGQSDLFGHIPEDAIQARQALRAVDEELVQTRKSLVSLRGSGQGGGGNLFGTLFGGLGEALGKARASIGDFIRSTVTQPTGLDDVAKSLNDQLGKVGKKLGKGQILSPEVETGRFSHGIDIMLNKLADLGDRVRGTGNAAIVTFGGIGDSVSNSATKATASLDKLQNSLKTAAQSATGFGPASAEVQALADAELFASSAAAELATAITLDAEATAELSAAQVRLAQAQASSSPTFLTDAMFKLEVAEEEAASAAARLTEAHNSANTAARNLDAAERKVAGGLGGVAAAQQKAATSATKAFSDVEKSASKHFDGAGKSVTRFVKQFLQQIEFLAVAGVGAFAGFALKSTADLETLHTALDTVFGAKAQEAFDKITAFAARTPFQIGGVTKEVVRLGSTFGITADQALNFLTIIGNAGAAIGANSEQIDNAVIALTQIQARGKLGGQELLQLANSLPNVTQVKILEEVGRILGVTGAEAQKMAEDGLVPASVAITAYLNAAKAVNPQQDAMAKQAKTLNGLFSTLKDTFNLVAAAALGPLVKALEKALDPVLNGEGSFEKLTAAAKNFGETVTNVFAQFGPSISNIFANIADLIPLLALNLKGVIDLVAELVKLFSDFTNILKPVAEAVLVVTGAILHFGASRAIIEGVLVGFLAFKALPAIFGPVFKALVSVGDVAIRFAQALGNLAAKVIEQAFGQNAFSTALRTTATAEAAAEVSTKSLASSLSGALSIGIGVAVAAWQIYNNIVSEAKRKTDEALTAASQAFNITPGAGVQAIKDQEAQLAAAQKIADEAKKKRDKEKSGVHGFLVDKFPNVDPAATLRQVAAEKALNEALKNRDKIQTQISLRTDVINATIAKTGATTEQVLAEATKQGLDIFHVDPASEAVFIRKLIDGLNAAKTAGAAGGTDIGIAIGKAVNDAFGNTIKGIQDKVKDAFAAEDALLTAQENLISANKAVSDIDAKIADLKKQQKDLSKDNLKITDELADALDAVRNLDRQITDLVEERTQARRDEQQRLDAYQPTLDDYADRAVAAQIALDQAKRKTTEAQDALNKVTADGLPEQSAFVNIAGLSLDAARARLAAVRSTLAAQKAGKKTEADGTKDAKTKVELQEDFTLAQIAERDAKRDIDKLDLDKKNFIYDSVTAQTEFNEKIEDLKVQEADLRRDRAIAADEYQKTLRGEIGIKKQIKDIDAELKGLADDRAEAAYKVSQAEADVRKAVAESKGDYDGILKATQDIYNLRRSHLTTEGLITAELNRQNGVIAAGAKDFKQIRDDIEAAAKASINAFIGPISPLQQAGIAQALDPRTINQIIDEALKDPTTSLHDIMKKVFQQLHISVPGFAKGGFIPQAATPFGRTIRVAEAGAEGILPLTSRSGMRRVLGDSRILDPILNALPQVSLPIDRLDKSSAPSNTVTEQQRRKEQREFAGYVADAIVARSGDTGGDITIHQTFETGQYIDTAQLARKAAREADRAFRKRNN